MLSFLRSPRFWLPLVILVAVELAFRTGLWEPFAKRDSYAGRAIALKKALSSVDRRPISHVTLGDSRTEHAFDHGEIHALGQRRGRVHYNLSMPGSHLATLVTESNWLVEHLPGLEGALVGISVGALDRTFNGYYEIGIVEPFRGVADYWPFGRFFPYRSGEPRSFGGMSALMSYRDDIQDLVRHPRARIREFTKRSPKPTDVVTGTASNRLDICEYDLTSLVTCIAESKQTLNGSENPTAIQSFRSYCPGAKRSIDSGVQPLTDQQLHAVDEWAAWTRRLAGRVKRLDLVIMPEHRLLREIPRCQALRGAFKDRLASAGAADKTRLLDLSEFLDHRSGPACSYFADLIHVNERGMAAVTSAWATATADGRP